MLLVWRSSAGAQKALSVGLVASVADHGQGSPAVVSRLQQWIFKETSELVTQPIAGLSSLSVGATSAAAGASSVYHSL